MKKFIDEKSGGSEGDKIYEHEATKISAEIDFRESIFHATNRSIKDVFF